MLSLIGLGLGKEDISLKGMKLLKESDEVYIEQYTGKWPYIKYLEKEIDKKIILLERNDVESDFLIEKAKDNSISLLVPGDPLVATTHFQFILDAKEQGVKVNTAHASSIYTVVGETGLQLYKFGRTSTLAKEKESYRPQSPYNIVKDNKKQGLHTLVLLDTKDGCMGVSEALRLLVKNSVIKATDKVVACACLGSMDKIIQYDTIEHIINRHIRKIPACIIIPGQLNFKEQEALKLWK